MNILEERKKAFIKMLEDVLLTMEKTQQENVFMSLWVYDEDDALTEDILEVFEMPKPYTCGYAACVLGDHVIRTKNIKLPISSDDLENINEFASDYSYELTDVCERVFDSPLIVESIFNGDEDDRRSNAFQTGLFTDEELDNFVHLKLHNPSTKDVIVYLKACIEMTKNYQG